MCRRDRRYGPARAGEGGSRRCYLSGVRRLALVSALLVPFAVSLPARADWEVRRTDSTALLERAERALLERPDDDNLARRLVKLAGPAGRARLRNRFRTRAERAATAGDRAAYAPLAAYAHLLSALGEAKAAVEAYDQLYVSRRSPCPRSPAVRARWRPPATMQTALRAWSTATMRLASISTASGTSERCTLGEPQSALHS